MLDFYIIDFDSICFFSLNRLIMSENKNGLQKIWGLALIFMGIAVVFRIPEIFERLKDNPVFSSGKIYVQFCFYFISMLLIVGGIKKLMTSKSDNIENKS